MKKLFIFTLLLPFLAFAEDPAVPGKIPALGDDPNAISQSATDPTNGALSTAIGASGKVCDLCKSPSNVRLVGGVNTNPGANSSGSGGSTTPNGVEVGQ